MSQANIDNYKKADTSQFPPMVIGNNGYLLDGNHRLQAYKAQGIKTVKAYIGESKIDLTLINQELSESRLFRTTNQFNMQSKQHYTDRILCLEHMLQTYTCWLMLLTISLQVK